MFGKRFFGATVLAVASFLFVSTVAAQADDKDGDCKDLPSFSALKGALIQAVATVRDSLL